MTQTHPIADAPHQRLGHFAIVGPDRKPIGERIAGAMVCGPVLREDEDFATVFTAAAPVRLYAPEGAITDECDEAGRIGFFSERDALMWTTKARARSVGQRMTLDGVRVIDGT